MIQVNWEYLKNATWYSLWKIAVLIEVDSEESCFMADQLYAEFMGWA